MSHDELTQARWEQLWSDSDPIYDPRLEPQLRDSPELIRRFWPDPHGRFLEAGFGSAANALNLALAGAEVVGVDVASAAVEQAEAAFGERGLAGSFVVGDVRALPFANGSFDFVYAGGVVEHFLETEKAVGEMVRVVDTGAACFSPFRR